MLSLRRKHIPEPKSLVAGACHECLSVGTASKVKDPKGVACERGQLFHGWVLPNEYLILRVPVSTYQLVDVLRKHQVAHLAPCLQVVDRLKRVRVPESDALVGRASAAREEPVLVR